VTPLFLEEKKRGQGEEKGTGYFSGRVEKKRGQATFLAGCE